MPDRSPARNRSAILLVLACTVSGCSDGGVAYPSLASRPVERLADAAPAPAAAPGPATAAAAPSVQLLAQLDDLVGQARSAKRAFDDSQATAERTIAAAGSAPPGSEAWARATQALSGAESARTRTAQPLADFDRLDVEDRLHGAGLGPDNGADARPDTAAITQARDTVAALVAAEDAALAKLDGRLAQ